MAPNGKYEPIRYQVWVLTLIWVMPAVWGFVRFLPPFPFHDPATATEWIPKLARNATCLPAYIGQTATDFYVVRYANTVFWLGLLGFGLGASILVARRQTALLKRPAVVDTVQTAPVAKVGNFTPQTDKWDFVRDRIVRAGRLAWACSVLFGFAVVMPWWWGFHSSACSWLDGGFPLQRTFLGLIPAAAAGLFFFNAGVVFAIVFGLMTGRLAMFEKVERSSPSASSNG